MSSVETRSIEAGGLEQTYLVQGEGPLVVCVHGFPDVPHTFLRQMAALSRAGYQVVAPFARGYAPTSAKEPYQPAAFGNDVLGLMDALGSERATLVGHDWGVAAVCAAALAAPERVEKLVTAALPYGVGLPTALVMNPEQQRRSWYVFFFQTRLAEVAIPMNDYAFIDRLWADWSPGFTAPAEHLRRVKDTLASSDTLSAALAYYRTSFNPKLRDPSLEERENRYGVDRITVDTLHIHGENDGCIGAEVSEGVENGFDRCRREVIPGVGHFCHLEDPDGFNLRLLEFLGSGAGR